MKTLVKAKYIIAFNGKEHVLLNNGQLVFENEQIIYIGDNYPGHYDTLIDESDNLLSPGFIDLDALGDVDHSLVFAEIPRSQIRDLYWSEDYFYHHRKEEMTAADEAFKSYYAYVNLIMNGITTAMPITSVICKAAGETYEEIVAAAHHAGKLGLRTYLGPSYLAKKHVWTDQGMAALKIGDEEIKNGLENAERFIEEFAGKYNGLIQACVVPERIELQTEETLLASKHLADKYHCPIRLHAAQGEFEYRYIKENTGLSPIAYLDSINFLDERTSIPHCLFTSGGGYVEDQSDSDLEILAQRRSNVIHCPLVYARSGKTLRSFARFRQQGINMCLGTDTYAPDMIENIKIGSIVAKIIDGECVENSHRAFFDAATLGGAQALGRDDIGSLKVGGKADMIVIDLKKFEMGVIDDILNSLFINGNGMMVKTSIINGRIVMKDRVIDGVDYAALQKRAQEIYQRMKNSYARRSKNQMLDPQKPFHQSLIDW